MPVPEFVILKKRLWHKFFTVNFVNRFRTIFLLPLFILEKLETSRIDCGNKIKKKPCLLTFLSGNFNMKAN